MSLSQLPELVLALLVRGVKIMFGLQVFKELFVPLWQRFNLLWKIHESLLQSVFLSHEGFFSGSLLGVSVPLTLDRDCVDWLVNELLGVPEFHEGVHQVHIPFLFVCYLPFQLEILVEKPIQSFHALTGMLRYDLLTELIYFFIDSASRSLPAATRVDSVRHTIQCSSSEIFLCFDSQSSSAPESINSRSAILLFLSSISLS